MSLENAPYPDIAAEFLGIETLENSTKPIMEESIEQDDNKEAAQSELKKERDKLPMRNESDDRPNDFNLMRTQMSWTDKK